MNISKPLQRALAEFKSFLDCLTVSFSLARTDAPWLCIALESIFPCALRCCLIASQALLFEKGKEAATLSLYVDLNYRV